MKTDNLTTCSGCGQDFEARRLNQQFCSQNCKTHFHNRRARKQRLEEKQQEAVAGQTNAILWNNRMLLEANKGQTFSIAEMEKVGFRIGYVTKIEKMKDGNTLYYCYDQKFTASQPNTLTIF